MIKITKDKKGRRWLEEDLIGAVKNKLESLLEDTPLKHLAKSLGSNLVPRDYHLDDVVKSEALDSGLRIEENNGDFYLISMPKEKAQEFVACIESSTDLMAGID